MADESAPPAGSAERTTAGRELALARERSGLTAQQVAEQLNLDVSVIHWIEHDDFAALGAPVFARGHLRRYAALLGLSTDRVLDAYERADTQPSQPTLIPRGRAEMLPERGPARWPWVLGGLAAFLIAAALVAMIAEHGLRLPFGRPADAPPTDTVQLDSGAPTPVAPGADTDAAASGSPAVAAAPGQDVASAAPAVAPPPGQVALTFRFSGDSWVEVYDGTGRAVLYDLGSRGSERSLTAAAPLRVTIGTPASVSVLANGRRLAPPSPEAGQTLVRFGVGADGALLPDGPDGMR